MDLRSGLRTLTASLALAAGLMAAAQTDTSSTPQTPAPATPAEPAAAPTPTPWKIGPMEVSGFLDGFYTYNNNNPTEDANGKMNDYYNFNQDANQPALSAAKLTLNHDPGPVGAHVDAIYGRTNRMINGSGQLEYVEQAYMSFKPKSWKGIEIDGGKFVTFAGAEVIEAKDNWNYSRSLLFAWAIPYWHFGGRASMPVGKAETIGVQVVNGWNNIRHPVGGPTFAITSTLVEPKFTWSADLYTGAADSPGQVQNGYRNLFDTTVLLTPTAKINAYVNFDFGQQLNKPTSLGFGEKSRDDWYGVAFAVHDQFAAAHAGTIRYETFKDSEGYETGTAQALQEFTGTYEYKWKYGLLGRTEFRHDWSSEATFHKANGKMTDQQNTVGIGMILVIAPKR
jgi:Putative beta-barrel porin-2, OmpL-like. bbp2